MPLPKMNNVVAGYAPLILWSGGRTQRASEKGRFTPFVGFHTEAGKYEELDVTCKRLSLPRGEVRHQDGTTKEYWFFGEELVVYPLTAGPVAASVGQSVKNGNAQRSAEAGIGVRWPVGEKSKCSVRAILKVLADAGYMEPVQMVANSMMGDYLLAALADHTRVCKAYSEADGRDNLFPGEVGLPLGAGPEVAFGKVQSTTMTPFVSQHPKKIDADYVLGLWRSDEVYQSIESHWDATVAWATEYGVPARPEAEQTEPGGFVVTPERIEQEISLATTQTRIEELRALTLEWRDKREITSGEQMRLGDLLDERLATLDETPF